MRDLVAVTGFGVADLFSHNGKLLRRVQFQNLVTDAGDLYLAQQAIAGISPASPSAPTGVSGMKLGTGTTAVAKNGAGAALVTYLSGSNAAFDATYPQTSNLGAGLGVRAVYRARWAAGTATNSAISEVVIVNDAGTNATSSAANTVARALFPEAIPKAAGDLLVVTWNHKILGG